MNEVKEYTEKVFEDIKHIDKNNHEYWLARDLMPLLEYSKWENFNNVIQKAITSYKNSNNDDTYWLPKVRKPIITGKGKEEFIKDYKDSTISYSIIKNINQLHDKGFWGVPSIVINNHIILDVFSQNEIEKAIESELSKNK